VVVVLPTHQRVIAVTAQQPVVAGPAVEGVVAGREGEVGVGDGKSGSENNIF
jgi:hypothetical protein